MDASKDMEIVGEAMKIRENEAEIKNKILWPMSRESKAYSLLSKTALMERGGPERQSIPKKYARRNTVCVVL